MDQLYVPMLAVHNVMRWVVIVAALYALYRYFTGLTQRKEYTNQDRQSGLFYTISMDIQLLVGLLLYFVLSPTVQAGLQDMGATMRNPQLRFVVVEHFTLMLIAVILVHVGSVMVRRAEDARSKFRRGAIFYPLATVAILAGIPWWQPLLRWPF